MTGVGSWTSDDSAVRFLSLASHDSRGPLATVRSYALASPRFALEERVRSRVEVMLRNVDRALARRDLLCCELTFWDSGPPLTPEQEAHAFDPRWQVHRGHELGSAFGWRSPRPWCKPMAVEQGWEIVLPAAR